MATVGDLGQGNLAYRESVSAPISGLPFSEGDSANTGQAGKLWLPIWSGEVINAYDEYNQFESMVQQRTIQSGHAVEIPITGTVDLKPSWDAGVELVGGSDAKTSTFQLKLDKRPMAAHFELDNVDLMLTQWEYRAELARQAALTLSNTRDKQLYSYLCRAGMTSQITNDPRPSLNLDSALYGQSDGSNTDKLMSWGAAGATAADRATGALSALERVEQYIVFLQENNIPYDRLFLAVSPQCFMDIRSLGVARSNSDLGGFIANGEGTAGGMRPMFAGVEQMGQLGGPLTQSYGQLADTLEYMGCTIIKTNHGADQLRDKSGEDATANGLGEAKYNLDFTQDGSADTTALIRGIRAVMFTPEAVGAIRLQGLKVDAVDDVRRNTTFTVASMMSGTGVLRPECAAIISANDITHEDWDTRAEHATKSAMDADGYAQTA